MHRKRFDGTTSLICPRCETKGRCKVCPEGTATSCWHPDRGTWGYAGPEGKEGQQLFFRDPPANPSAPTVLKARPEHKPKPANPLFPVATSGELDRVFSRWLELCPPTTEDVARLATERGLSADRIKAIRIGRLPDKEGQKALLGALERLFDRDLLLKVPGILLRRGRLVINAAGQGLLIPVGPPAGEPVSSLQLRLDEPLDGERYRLLSGGEKGAKASPEPYVVKPTRAKPGLAVLTEGWSKALAGADRFGALAIGIPGVSSWALALAELKKAGAKEVLVAWDADHKTKPQVFKPLKAAVEKLRAEGYIVRLVLWPAAHKGVDDALLAGAELQELAGDQVAQHLLDVADLLGLSEAVRQAKPNPGDPLAAFTALGTEYADHELKAALRSVATTAEGLDAVDRAVLQSNLIRHLKRIKAPDASNLARATLGTSGEDERDKETGPRTRPQEPCPEPVSGAEVLDQVEKLLLRFAILPDGASVAIPLWLLHTYLIPHLTFTPRLAVLSPVKRCGKSTLLNLLQELAEKAMVTSSLTAAALFRAMDAFQPTIIADEADTWIVNNEDLRGVVNTGYHKPNAYLHRCIGDKHELKAFACFGAVAIAGIGRLPDTIQDRSIIVSMRRKRAGEEVERLRQDVLQAAARAVKPRLARWAADNAEEVRKAQPELPKALHDRAADCWEPLLAIADLAGGAWPKRARHAALVLSGADVQQDEDIGVMLLSDIRDIFERRRTDRIRSAHLLEHLCSFEERPWCEWKKGQPLSPRGLSNLLRPFGVSVKNYRDSFGEQGKGYLLECFEDAFERYLGGSVAEQTTTTSQAPPNLSVTSVTTSNGAGLRDYVSVTSTDPVTDRSVEETARLSHVTDVTDRTPRESEKTEDGEANLAALAPPPREVLFSELLDPEDRAAELELEELDARRTRKPLTSAVGV